MIETLKNACQGRKICINDVWYDSIESYLQDNSLTGIQTIMIAKGTGRTVKTEDKPAKTDSDSLKEGTEYEISVKTYMTRPSTPEFDFMAKFNDNVPMPMLQMRGYVTKQTRGMYYMKLVGVGHATCSCRVCGRPLTNEVSTYYGIGPICLQKLGIMADISEISAIRRSLDEIYWEGWVIKTSITEAKEIEQTDKIL